MNRWLFAVIIIAALLPTTLPNAAANPDSTEPIPELFERVSPSVVSISAVALDPFDVNNRVSLVVGSGFIVSTDGLVLTNSHVVFGHQGIAVTLGRGPLNRPTGEGCEENRSDSIRRQLVKRLARIMHETPSPKPDAGGQGWSAPQSASGASTFLG